LGRTALTLLLALALGACTLTRVTRSDGSSFTLWTFSEVNVVADDWSDERLVCAETPPAYHTHVVAGDTSFQNAAIVAALGVALASIIGLFA